MKDNKKMIIVLASVVGVILLIIIVLMLIASGNSNKSLSYSEIEDKLMESAAKYYSDNSNSLSLSLYVSKEVNASELVSAGYMRELDDYTPDGISCSGSVIMTNTISGMNYTPKLNCGNSYSTKQLNEVLKDDIVVSGKGLYETVQLNPNTGMMETVYVYRGENLNNYIKVGEIYWQIIKIKEDGSIAVISEYEPNQRLWDDRYNSVTEQQRGINVYLVSRMKEYIDSVTGNNNYYAKFKKLATYHTACIAPRTVEDAVNDGSIECSETLENQLFSLMPVYDYINASLDEHCSMALDNECGNYNYLNSNNVKIKHEEGTIYYNYDGYWTITANSENTDGVFTIQNRPKSYYTDNSSGIRLYATLRSGLDYVSGSGTYDDPYIVK